MFAYLYYRFYSLYHTMGIRLYRRWLSVISLTLATGLQVISVDTMMHNYLGTPEFLSSFQILMVFIALMFLSGYFLLMRHEPHFRIMGKYRMETRKSIRKGWIVLALYLVFTVSLFFMAGLLRIEM
jgi:hypothetical protein